MRVDAGHVGGLRVVRNEEEEERHQARRDRLLIFRAKQLKRLRADIKRLRSRSPSPSSPNAALGFLFGFVACFSLLVCTFVAVFLASGGRIQVAQ